MSGTGRSHRIVPAIRQWYRRHGRVLPWRDVTDPYRVILSEVMLQQTQVGRVLVKYPDFLRRFPSMRALSRAPVRDVIRAWQGMGYNSRAVRLHALAAVIVNRFNGKVPFTAQLLMDLPGIGRYTAHAILSSVHGLPVPVVDVNVRRLLSRVFWRMPTTAALKSEGAIWQVAGAILPRSGTYDWNQALMDIGATICTARQPACEICPLAAQCLSQASMERVQPGPRRSESGLDGIPNRIYRGRVIETLRGVRHSLSEGEIGKAIHPVFSRKHARWLDALLKGLEKDGLVRIRRGRNSLASRVHLA